MIDKRTKRFIDQRDRAEALVRVLEAENARLKAQVARMRPVVEAAGRWYAGTAPSRTLELSIETYRTSKAVQ